MRVRLSSGFEASDYAAKKTDANKRLLVDKVTFVDSLRAPEVRQCSSVDRDFRASNSFFEFQVLV